MSEGKRKKQKTHEGPDWIQGTKNLQNKLKKRESSYNTDHCRKRFFPIWGKMINTGPKISTSKKTEIPKKAETGGQNPPSL